MQSREVDGNREEELDRKVVKTMGSKWCVMRSKSSSFLPVFQQQPKTQQPQHLSITQKKLQNQLSSDIETIRGEIATIRDEVGNYFIQSSRHNPQSKFLQYPPSPTSPTSPTAKLQSHNFLPSQLMIDRLDLSSDSDVGVFQIKYEIVSEALRVLKRKYTARKAEFKKRLGGFEKRTGELERCLFERENELVECKGRLRSEMSKIKSQLLRGMYQDQLRGRGSNEPNPEEELQNSKQVLSHTSTEQQHQRETMQQMRLQIQKLQNISQSLLTLTKEKQDLDVRYSVQEDILRRLAVELQKQKEVSEGYKQQLEEFCWTSDELLREHQQREEYLRTELGNSLGRESRMEIEFREVQSKRTEHLASNITALRDQVSNKNASIVLLQSQLDVKEQSLTALKEKINRIASRYSFEQLMEACEADKEELVQLQEDSQPNIEPPELNKLTRKYTSLQRKHKQVVDSVETIRNDSENRLLQVEMDARKARTMCEDRLKQIEDIVMKQGTDDTMKEIQYKLVQKEQEMLGLGLALFEAKQQLSNTQTVIHRLRLDHLMDQCFPAISEPLEILENQNSHLQLLISSLNSKIHILTQLNSKKDTILQQNLQPLSKEEAQLLLSRILLEVPGDLHQKLKADTTEILHLKRENRRLLQKLEPEEMGDLSEQS